MRRKLIMSLMMILMKIFRFSCTFLVEAHAAQLVQAGGQQEWLDQGLAAAPIKVVMMNIVVIMIMLVKVGITEAMIVMVVVIIKVMVFTIVVTLLDF